MLNDWNINPDPETLAYHERQWDRIYGSTIDFARFADRWLCDSTRVYDLGCGAGSSTAWLAEEYPAKFVGVDISDKLLDIARSKTKYIENVNFRKGDMCNLLHESDVDGVISLQCLSWMRTIETPLDQICTKIRPQWMAFSSLFYEGEISCEIVVNERTRPRKSYYNIYSIPEVCRILYGHGYKLAAHQPFLIGADLPKPNNIDLMKTYTIPSEEGPRLQISGPLMLPWYFLAFEREV